jgi:hypothetical protein
MLFALNTQVENALNARKRSLLTFCVLLLRDTVSEKVHNNKNISSVRSINYICVQQFLYWWNWSCEGWGKFQIGSRKDRELIIQSYLQEQSATIRIYEYLKSAHVVAIQRLSIILTLLTYQSGYGFTIVGGSNVKS